jgi:hypothetical protein
MPQRRSVRRQPVQGPDGNTEEAWLIVEIRDQRIRLACPRSRATGQNFCKVLYMNLLT